jgi:N-acetylglucosamine-6-phosphate deacetylase
MHNAVANAARFTDLTLEEALPLASTRPAAYLDETPLGTVELEWDPEAGTLRVVVVRDSAR